MKSSKGKGLIGLLILLIAVGLFGFLGYDTMDDIKLGLDLAGGVSITYQAVEEEPGQEEMSDTIYKLQQRVQNYSTEAEVYQEGNNRINIDIPGVSDANAILEELGKPGSLIFADENGKTNLSLDQVQGQLLLVSQFTLYANCRKGNRPSFLDAGDPDEARTLFDHIVEICRQSVPVVRTGSFGADMKVRLCNDGPFTIMLDSDEILG